jgi:hypothetical protein
MYDNYRNYRRCSHQTIKLNQTITFSYKKKKLVGKVYEIGNGTANVKVGDKKYFINNTNGDHWVGINEI